MSRNNPGLTLAYAAESVIPPRSLVKHGAADGGAALATDSGDALLGVSTDIAAAIGQHVDVIREGVAPVLYGGTVARGAALTANATGAAIEADPGDEVAGYAEVSGVAGDIGSIHLQRGTAA